MAGDGRVREEPAGGTSVPVVSLIGVGAGGYEEAAFEGEHDFPCGLAYPRCGSGRCRPRPAGDIRLPSDLAFCIERVADEDRAGQPDLLPPEVGDGRPLVLRAVIPQTMLSVTRLDTSGRPHWPCAQNAASMCSGEAFMLSMLISTLSSSVTVRPADARSRCRRRSSS